MPSFKLGTACVRSVSIAALIGAATMFAAAARAEPPAASAPDAVIRLAQAGASKNRATRDATEAKGVTVEQRITNLHNGLRITPDQEAKWAPVAQAMRENATNMDTLIAENRKTAPQAMTALDDLKTAQKVEQAHVDGLKNLIASFETLYAAMPDAQKKLVDDVFRAPRGSPPAVYYGPYFPFVPFIRW